MGAQLPVREGWKDQLVVTRTVSGQIYVLLHVEKRTCDNCAWGTEFVTMWTSPRGQTERLTWCTSCFNASWEPARPGPGDAARLRELMERVQAAPQLVSWNGARAAIADLERKGLL